MRRREEAGGGGGGADTELKTKTPHVNVGKKKTLQFLVCFPRVHATLLLI